VANPFSNLEDSNLMLKYQDGDHMAFEVLYLRHKDKVYSYIKSRLHKSDDVEDLFQKVFVKFHKSRHLYNSKYDVLPWIYTITKSEFLDFIKKKNVLTSQFNEVIHTNTEDVKENSFDIQNEESLSHKEKNAIKMRYVDDNDFLEISKILEISESNARKIISRGLKKLKKKYTGVKS
jgi:RNA polymerase sigma-70 factor (ECF subfamily)